MDINVNQWIPAQFPSHFQAEGPLFVAFIKAYYEYLELDGKPTNVIRSFLENIDIDTTQEKFVQYFKDEFMADLPNTMVTNQRLLIKHIVDLYRSKGTPRGFELLFRILFNEDIRLYIPGQFVFKPSDNTWVTKKYIEVSDSPFLKDLVGLSIFCSTDKATAMVEEFNVININNKLINILVLSNITGNFNFGSKVLSNDLTEITIDNAPLVVGSLSAISLENGGALFNLGDTVNIQGSGSDGVGIISSIRTENGKVIFKLVNGGFGYTLNAQVQVVGGNGSGATFAVGSLVDQETFVINIDQLGSYYNTQLDSNTAGFQLNLSGIVGSFTVGQSVNAQANGVGLDFAYLSGALANGEVLSNTALGIAGLTVVEIDNPNFVNLTGTNANLLNANLVSGVTLHGATSGASIFVNSVLPFVDYAANGVVTASNSTSVSVNNFSGYFLPSSKLLGPAGNGTITTTIRKTDWLFPSFNSPDNMDSQIQNVLTYNTMVVGTIASLTAENPGDGYISNPTVTITEPLIAELGIDDGIGGIWGNDAIVTATANSANGIATSVAIINSGYGYAPGETLILQGPGEIAATGVAIVDGTGVSKGFWTSNKSFASDEIFIEDSFYYQPFSYEIIAPRMQSTYEKFVQELVHPVGMVMFGRYYMEDRIDASSSMIVFPDQGNTGGGNTAPVSTLFLPAGRQMLDLTQPLGQSVVAYAHAREDGSYDSLGPVFANDPLWQNPHIWDNSRTLDAETHDNLSTYGTALKWGGDPWLLNQHGWWFDVDHGGNLNPIQQAMWLENQPVGSGFSQSVLFYISGDSGGGDAVNLIGRGANLDDFASSGGIFIQGSAGSYTIRGEVYNRPSGPGSEIAAVIGSTSVTLHQIHMAVVTVQNDVSTTSATAKFYLDGELIGTQGGLDVISAGAGDSVHSGTFARTGGTNNNEAQLQIGGFYHEFGGTGNFGYPLNGYVFQGVIYDHAITPTDVTNLWANPYSIITGYSAPIPNSWIPSDESSLIGHWTASTGVTQSGGAVTAWADQSGHTNNLTASGTAGAVQYSATGFNGAFPGLTVNKSVSSGFMTGAIPQIDGTVPTSIFMTILVPYLAETLSDGDGIIGLIANGASHDYSDGGSFGTHFTTEGRNTLSSLSNFNFLGPALGCAIAPSLPFTYGIIFDGTNAKVYLNGVLCNGPTAWGKMGAVGGSTLNLFSAYTGIGSFSIADLVAFKGVINPKNYEAYAETNFGVPLTNSTMPIRCG